MARTQRPAAARLGLVAETLRTLHVAALDHVHGGGTIVAALGRLSGTCNSGICSIGQDCRIGGKPEGAP
jgi:hypothetical protein